MSASTSLTTTLRSVSRTNAVAALVATALLAGFPGRASPQEGAGVGEDVEVDLSGYVQLQAATTSCSDVPIPPTSACAAQAPGLDLFLRRSRFEAAVVVSDRIDGEIGADFSTGGINVRDAWGRLTLSPAVRLQAGHFKRPFDGFALTSSTRILTIERDLDVPGVPGIRATSLNELTSAFRLSDRDVGVMLNGTTGEGRLEYWAGIFNGEADAPDGDRNAGKQFVGRGRYGFRLEDLPAAVAVAVARTDLPFTGPEGEITAEYYSNVELWAELGDFEAGPHVQAGLVFGENPLQSEDGTPLRPPGPSPFAEDFARMTAWQVIGTYRFPIDEEDGAGGWLTAVEPLLRISHAEPNRDLPDDEVRGFTPGVNLHFGGRNAIALNWDFVTFAGDTGSANSFKAQYQFYF